MIDWWQGLNRREQTLVSCAGLFVLGAAIFLFVLEPLLLEHKVLDSRLHAERGALERIEQHAAESQILRERISGSPNQTIDRSESLLSILNKTSAQHELQNKVKRIVPNGTDKANVVFDSVIFDGLTAWLVDLQAKYGVSVDRITVDKQKDTGTVRANVSLAR